MSGESSDPCSEHLNKIIAEGAPLLLIAFALILYRPILLTRRANWDYYSTVTFSLDAPGEGCCEPVIARSSDGDLLCVMRVSSNLPMWACRSADDGGTWSDPHPLPFYSASVFPDMVAMSNGILAVSFGRPGAHVMFSVDGEGRRWTARTTIHSGTNTDAYTAIREIAPGRLLYVFHENRTDDSGQRVNAIRGVFVEVKTK